MIELGVVKLTDDVYSVGVLNPNMRIFDVIMRTEFGTSYNAYLIKGEKNVLIETTHPRYFEEYLENISSVVDPKTIDYVIMNHNEPDHSGSLAKLLEVAPQIQVLTSQAGAIYLRNITNEPNAHIRAVKDGETLDIGGGKELRFVIAPFLHWPDSMFTYYAAEKIAFTCDFLGAHYCEPRMIDSHVTYPQRYESAFENYYTAIFGPFKPYVLKGLAKLDELDVDTVCTSHGPVLTKGVYLEKNKELYRKWSQPAVREKKYIPIFYCSAYGYTGELGKKIAEGIRNVLPDAVVEVMDVNEHPFDELAHKINENDAFLPGSPTINKDAVRPIWLLAAAIDLINAKGRPAAAFGSFGWSGEAVPMLVERLKSMKLNVFENGFTARFVPSDAEFADAVAFGKRFAEQLKA